MSCTDPRASQHGEGGLDDHGHVDEDSITSLDTELLLIDTSQTANFTLHLSVSPGTGMSCVCAVSIHGDLIAAAFFHMSIQRVVADVHFSVREPPPLGITGARLV